MTPDHNPHMPEDAKGTGEELFNARTRFYLANNSRIEEWAGLRAKAANTVAEWHKVHAGDLLQEIASRIGYTHHYVRTGNWRSSVIAPPGTEVVDDEPAIGLGVGWWIHDVGNTYNNRRGRPSVGIRVDATTAAGLEGREQLLVDGGRDLRDSNGYHSTKEWPVWSFIDFEATWWAKLDAHATRVRQAAEVLLELFGPRLDAIGGPETTSAWGST